MNPALVAALALSLVPDVAAAVETAPWHDYRVPSSGPAQAIGSHALGCLGGAVTLPNEGVGYRVLRPDRQRHYGHPTLIRFVEDLGRKVAALGLGTLLVGDLAQPRGGPMAYGHNSHQSGLDVDLWFRLQPLDVAKRKNPQPAGMVQADGAMSSAWTAAQERLLELAAAAPEVDRIFVNPAIKRAACRSSAGDRAWLRKLRPWRGHDQHFHVRLRCPDDSPDCKPQPQVPPGDGCDEAESWASAGSLLEAQLQPPADAPVRPPLPQACGAVLRN